MKLDPEREAAITHAKREIERTLREPGFFQWMELANDRSVDVPADRWRAFHDRIYDLISDYARELGISATTVEQASVLSSLLIGPGYDGGDDREPESVPDPERPEAVKL